VRRSSTILIALLLLMPVMSWTASTGGLTACLQGRHQCAMTMVPGAICHMQAAPSLTLPACMVPVMPLPARVTGIPAPAVWPSATSFALAFATAPALPIFHPPQA